MITEIGINFRHLRNIAINGLTGANIIVGPNNSGKTSIFRGIHDMTSKPPHKDDYLCIGTRIDIPKPLIAKIEHSDAKWLLKSSFVAEDGPTQGLVLWSRRDRIQQSLIYFGTFCVTPPDWITLEIDEHAIKIRPVEEILTKGNLAPYPRTITSPFTAPQANLLKSNGTIHNIWLRNLYFLWHRRKSRYEEELGAFHGRLDAEAEHLAGRLDHLLSETRGGQVRDRIDAFMNEVVPGIGTIGIKRSQPQSDKQTIISIVFSDGRADRTLEQLGGGVEQILALAIVLIGEKDEGAVFIEEPESHLHESAQRRLIEQIVRHRGARQIFIATHSQVFVNEFPGANVYRVTRNSDGDARVDPCVDKASQREVLNDLGVLPSSLTQTNCVIWVEGPTETRLVRHWLGLLAPELKVHQHYEFAETGGSNLVSMAADLPHDDPRDLRDIMRVCRHNFMICDRDAGIGSTPAKTPVQKIEELVGKNYWITYGYEIEWYIPKDAIASLWSQPVADHMSECALADEPFYARLKTTGERGTKSPGDNKVMWAERIVSKNFDAQLWFTGKMGEDLRIQVERLATFIRQANQMSTPSTAACRTCGQTRPPT